MTILIAEEKRQAARSSAAVFGLELWSLTGLLATYGLANAFFDDAGATVINFIGPCFLCAVLGYGAWRMARDDSAALWTPLFWLRVSTIFYFGLGSLAPFIANTPTLEYMRTLYAFTPEEMLKLNALVALGLLAALGAAAAFDWFWPRRRDAGAALAGLDRSGGVLAAGIGFILVGGAYKYLVLLPQSLGLIAFTIPGVFTNFEAFAYVGVFLITAWAARHAQLAWVLVALFLCVELGTALLTLSKQQVLFTLLMACLGFLTRGVTLLRALPLAAAMTLTYTFLQPLVSHARDEQFARMGSLSAPASVEQRLQFLSSYFTTQATEGPTGEPIQGWLSRLSYVNAGTFVISRYDSGSPGDSFRYAAYSLVPRVIWPDKPIISDVGRELAELASGRRSENSIGAGWFAEIYWNLGWAGILMLMGPLGVLFSLLSRYAASVLRQGHWLSLPVVFLGLKMGARVDGAFVTDVVGATVILAAYMAAVSMVRIFIPPPSPAPARR